MPFLLGIRRDRLDFVQLIRTVERHHVHTIGLGELQVRSRLCWIGENNPGRRHPNVQNRLDLGLRGAIETGAEGSEHATYVHTIVGLDS